MNFKFWLILSLSLIASLLIGWKVVLPLLPTQSHPAPSQSLSTLRINNTKIAVELADDPQSIQAGLSHRDSLPQNQGMLFILPQKTQPVFWMKGMNFDLDMIFIDQGLVVDIAQNVPAPKSGEDPITYQPPVPITQVLEVNAGWVLKNGIRVGDPVYLIKQ